MAFFADPDGNELTLHRRYAPYTDGTPAVIGAERVDFVAVPVTDKERALEFYGETLGLEREPEVAHADWPEFALGNVTDRSSPRSGSAARCSPAVRAIALRVPDVAEARRSSRRQGSSSSARRSTPASATWRSSEDPDGNGLMLHHRYAAYADGATPVAMQVEHVDFVSVLTQDLQRAKQFYVETLGLEVETEGESDMELRCGQVTLDVFDPSSIGQPFAPSPAGVALRVADVDAARAELEAKGVVFDGDTITTGVCKQAWFKDPDGNALMLHRRFDV